jgi:small GTP-binding protein
MKLSLWDTAGQETYKSVTRSYFRGASGALLVFDLTRKSTFQHVTDWLNDLRQIAEPDIVVVLVGNKADLASPHTPEEQTGGAGQGAGGGGNQREVTRQEAEEWARRNGILEYVETSAKSGENVEMAFMRVAERIFQNIQAGKYDLNDRRSGVKGPSAGGAGGGASKPVRLTSDANKSLAGGCC